MMKQTGGSIAKVMGGHWVGGGAVVAGWPGEPQVHIVKGPCVGPCVARTNGRTKVTSLPFLGRLKAMLVSCQPTRTGPGPWKEGAG